MIKEAQMKAKSSSQHFELGGTRAYVRKEMPYDPVPWRMGQTCGLYLIKTHIGKRLQLFLTLIKGLIIFAVDDLACI